MQHMLALLDFATLRSLPLTRHAYANNAVRCRQCGATSVHARDLVHDQDCWGQRYWRDEAWHWPANASAADPEEELYHD